MKEILLRKSDELNGACRSYFESIKAWMEQEKRTTFTSREIRQALRLNGNNQKRYMLVLSAGQYIRKVKGTKAKGYEYTVTSPQEYERLQENIAHVMDEILEKLKERFSSSPVVQSKNEPPKRKKVKALAQ
jgi:transcription initiation factor IIE alpha subunit